MNNAVFVGVLSFILLLRTLLDTGKEGETPKYIENLLKVISYLPEVHPVQVYNVYTYYIWDFSYVPLIS